MALPGISTEFRNARCVRLHSNWSGLCRVIHTQEARKRLGNRLSTRSEEYCDLQFEVKSKRGRKEETSVSRKYCRWKAEYGVREVRWYRFPLPMKRR